MPAMQFLVRVYCTTIDLVVNYFSQLQQSSQQQRQRARDTLMASHRITIISLQNSTQKLVGKYQLGSSPPVQERLGEEGARKARTQIPARPPLTAAAVAVVVILTALNSMAVHSMLGMGRIQVAAEVTNLEDSEMATWKCPH